MKVFMLGWEFPPFISGGLGTACYGLTRAMSELDVQVTFVLPRSADGQFTTHVNMLTPESVGDVSALTACDRPGHCPDDPLLKIQTIDSMLQPYDRPAAYKQRILDAKKRAHEQTYKTFNAEEYISSPLESIDQHYGSDIHSEVRRYASLAGRLAQTETFDVVHAHDWMTYCAGVNAAKLTGKPLVVHVHSTEFDRCGENINQVIYDIERYGMHHADRILAVSNYTRNIITSRYGIHPDKVRVVHNGVEPALQTAHKPQRLRIRKKDKVVLFLGRITMQKGPEYFIHAARKIVNVMDNVKFVMAGSGDMYERMIEMAAELGIGANVLFTGFLRGDDVRRAYEMADVFVMPSVSEPFGLVPLEALNNDVPVIISKQSGVSEVLKHALKVDFWDVDEMANKIISVLRHPALSTTLKGHGRHEVSHINWYDSAHKCINAYKEVITAS
jgi:glycosyltransferase involved in cell wall biosynthesis